MSWDAESLVCCIHSEDDCRFLIQCAKMGRIRRLRARLTDGEKRRIRPGHVYIYNENESGIRRWTDKKVWTPSRLQDSFLVYRDLNGPFIKKAYSLKQEGGRFHVVVYTLAEWEQSGRCCMFFKDALEAIGADRHAGHPKSGWSASNEAFSMFQHFSQEPCPHYQPYGGDAAPSPDNPFFRHPGGARKSIDLEHMKDVADGIASCRYLQDAEDFSIYLNKILDLDAPACAEVAKFGRERDHEKTMEN